MTYREEHEAFVTGHTGTTFTEVAYLLLVLPLSVLLYSSVYAYFKLDKFELARRRSYRSLSSFAPLGYVFILDFICHVVPPILALNVTELGNITYIAIAVVSVVLLDALPKSQKHKKLPSSAAAKVKASLSGSSTATGAGSASQAVHTQPRLPFLSNYRAGMRIMTFIAILAVDFKVFPRRFAKTETYGVSLMDVGVGSFVLSTAIVLQAGRGRGERILAAVRSMGVLALLGAGRLVATKAADYHEHVSEYGVHWNFFFTMALVTVLAAAVRPRSAKLAGALGLAVAVVYQLVLTEAGLSDYIINQPRGPDLLSQNKEGLCSIAGYFALVLLGNLLGDFLLSPVRPKRPKPETAVPEAGGHRTTRDWWICAAQLACVAVACFAAYAAAARFVEPPSRRLANLAYVLLVASLNVGVLALLLVVQLAVAAVGVAAVPHSPIVAAVNRNGLALFLLANLLVGVVNLSMHTIYADETTSVTVITLYMLIVCALAVLLDSILNKSLKL